MAVIGKIRKRSGLLVAIVGIALAAFVLGDFFTGSRRSVPNIGKIGDQTISHREFDFKAEELLAQIQEQNDNRNLSSDQIYEVRQEAWKNLVKETLLKKELEAIGVIVTDEELLDMIQGNNPHPYILQSFTDPQTGMFNKAAVANFIQTLDQREPELKRQWYNLEKSIIEERTFTKYNNLIKKAYYVPKAFAKKDHEDKYKSVDFNFLVLRYKDIKDEEVTVTKNALQKAYNEHKHEFDAKEAIRSIEYIVFDIVPSEDDRLKHETEIAELFEEFQTTEEIAYFVNTHSDIRYDSTYKKQEELPLLFDSIIFNAPIGTTIEPMNEGYNYYMARLIDIQNRPDSAKASHILISYAAALQAPQTLTRTKEEAQALADSLLAVVKKSPDKFIELTNEFSDDPSKVENQGDLDWFADGMMVFPFNEACIKGKKGDKVVVETDFGFHVIHITDLTTPLKKARVAIIQRELVPSTDTYQFIYSQANKFAVENKTIDLFEKAVVELGKPKRIADNIKIMDNNIVGLSSPREIVRWAYDEKTDVNSISRIFEIDDKFIIAVLKGKTEKGIPRLEDIKDKIEPLAIKMLKADLLEKRLKDIGTGSLENMAQKAGVKVELASDMRFSSNNMPAIGPEPKVIGTALALSKGTISQPIKGNNGVFVVQVNNINEAPETDNYMSSKMMMKNYFVQRVQFDINNALEKVYKVEDNRHIFY